MKKTLLVIFLFVICLGNCSVITKNDTRAVKDTIQRYNKLLAEGYAKMDMTPLREVATEKHIQKVYHHMAALGESKIRMESQLIGIEFLDIQFPKEDLAKVKTREKWNYSHIEIDTTMRGQNVVQGLIYKLTYELVKENCRWLVSSISVLEEDMPEKDSQVDRSYLEMN